MHPFLFLKHAAQQLGLFDAEVPVKAHVRRDGVVVQAHTAKRKKKVKQPKKKDIPSHFGLDLFEQDQSADANSDQTSEPLKTKEKQPSDKQNAGKRSNKADDLITANNGQVAGLELKKPDSDNWALLMPDASDTGRFRIQWFDRRGTSAHETHNTPEEALDSAIQQGYTEHDQGAVDRLSGTPEWDQGMRWNWQRQSGRPDYGLPFDQAMFMVGKFGVEPGVTKAERKSINAKAREILGQKAYSDEEKAILSQYSGTGGVGDSLNEFYTRPDVAGAIWKILNTLGVSGGNILEPSAGTGVFEHAAPWGTQVTAVELDPISAKINSILHDKHDVHQSSMEAFATSDMRQFDGVVGNVPFGVRGSLVKDDKPKLPTAEQYFLDTAIDKTKPGGVIALIVPTGVMDNKNTRSFRERLLRKAQFVGAHRLPNTAFEHSHTGVTSDIVVFRKRQDDVAGALSTVSQDTLKEIGVWDEEFLAGGYFAGRGNDNVYGTPEAGWRSKAGMGNDFTVTGSMDGVAGAIAEWEPATPVSADIRDVHTILDALDDDKAKQRAVSAALKRPYEVAQPGDTKTVNGITYVLQGEPPRWHRVGSDEDRESVTSAGDVANMIDRLFTDPDGVNRKGLKQALDEYVAKHGNPSFNKELELAARDDKRLWRLIGAVNKDGSYSDLVTGRKVQDDSFEGAVARLAAQNGKFTADEVAADWTGGDREAALDHLFAAPGYAVEADGKTWTNIDRYLSGELWPKYDAAKEAMEHDGLDSAYRKKYADQLHALEEAIDPQSLEDVEIQINSGWVPLDVMEAWQKSRTTDYKKENPRGWTPDPFHIRFEGAVYTVTGGLYGTNLLEKYLNRTGVKKDDMPAIEAMNQQFKEWVLGSEHRDRVEDLYNRAFHGFRNKEYSKAPMEIPGLTTEKKVNDYVYSGVRWALDNGKGIIADDVGLGKSVAGLIVARMAKVTGQAKKPLIVVPKSVLANWVAEAEMWFPGSKVMVIGETYSKDKNGELKGKADTKAVRDRKLHELSQNDYDFVLISLPAFNDLDIDPITKGDYLNDDFWVQRGDSLGNAGDKRINKIRSAYEQAKAGREFEKRTDVIYFNDIGVDMIIADEAHANKNLFGIRSRFGESPKFLGGGGLSNRAQDMQYKARWIRDHNNNKNVYFLTATPTKNSPLEVYSMLAHIAPEAFEKIGIKNSEEFIDRFVEFKDENILGTDGQIKKALVTAGFKNLNELREIMNRYINRRTAEDVGLSLPARNDHQHMVDMTARQEAVYAELRELATESGGQDASGDSHIFSIMDKMGKAAVDLELLGEEHKGAKSPKIQAVVDRAIEGAKDGGQVIFADHNDLHEKIRRELVKRGIPEGDIAVLNAKVASTSAKRQRISDQFNAGKLKVVIGNTATMGEGVNLQKRTTDIHHLELPWEPASMQQRNGRGLRQGNTNEAVRIHTYLAKGSFDGYRWQTLAAKKDWQDLLWNGGDRVENLSLEGNLSRDDMLIMLSADPDQARKDYDSNKAAALERQSAEARTKAAGQFVRLQEMKRSYGRLGNKGTKVASRLKSKMDNIKAGLNGNKHFTAKEALDIKAPVLVQPDTGTAWYVGTALEMDSGKNAPIHWSDTDKSRWVVTGVDMGRKTVSIRQYGRLKAGTKTISIDDMSHGLRPIEYDAGKEATEERHDAIAQSYSSAIKEMLGVEEVKTHLKPMAHAVAEAVKKAEQAHEWNHKEATRDAMWVGIRNALYESAPDRVDNGKLDTKANAIYRRVLLGSHGINPEHLKHPRDLAGLPPATVETLMGPLQDYFKDAARDYSGSYSGPVGLYDKTGNAVADQSFSFRKKLDDHDLMFPTPEGRMKAMSAWKQMRLSRKISIQYPSTNRNRSRSAPMGVKEAYPGFEYGSETGNPWDRIGKDLFGGGFAVEAQKEFGKERLSAAVNAPDFGEAVKAAIAIPEIEYSGRVLWTPETLRALHDNAIKNGVLDASLDDVHPHSLPREIWRQKENWKGVKGTVRGILADLAEDTGITDWVDKEAA